jgi:hypothetical protein
LAVDGVKTSGYSITPSEAALRRGLQRAVTAAELTPVQAEEHRKLMLQGFSSLGTTTELWIDASGLVRRMMFYAHGILSANEKTEMTVTEQDFGAAVPAVALPQTGVVTYAAVLGRCSPIIPSPLLVRRPPGVQEAETCSVDETSPECRHHLGVDRRTPVGLVLR